MIWQRRHSQAHRDLVIAKMPLEPEHDGRDPWMLPSILFAAALTVYFIWQFSR